MPTFRIFAYKEIDRDSADLVKRDIEGEEEDADKALEALEDDGYEISDVHVFHRSIVREQEATPVRQHRDRGRR